MRCTNKGFVCKCFEKVSNLKMSDTLGGGGGEPLMEPKE
jgi:hypothetical protein